ncbi:MAG: MerC domain-containing protein [Boseongicola sp.]|nr:MerC domain-containing protein [Boseongicola sp.]
MNNFSQYIPFLDKFAVTTSGLCAIHCLSLPMLLAIFPALGATLFGQESFHVWLLWLVIPLSIIALSMGCRKHKSWLVALLGFIGLSVLVIAASFGHDVLGETGERVATLMGVTVIAVGHVRNYTLCRRVECDQ